MDKVEGRSRRAILATGLGVIGAGLAQALARPLPTLATHLGYVEKAHPNQLVSDTTGLSNSYSGNNTTVFVAQSHQAGVGILGSSAGQDGVRGYSGAATKSGGWFDNGGGGYGVVGSTSSNTLAAMWGVNYGSSYGVRGSSNASGTGGFFEGGTAIKADGKIRFKRSGKATISAGASSKTVTLSGVGSSSMVFAVLAQSRSGRWVRAVVPASGSFTIYLNNTVSSDTKVSWFVLDPFA
jgi:hypothetical protein